MTYKLFPLEKNKVLARFENLADRFDPGSTIGYVDVQEFAMSLYKEANPSSQRNIVPRISEVGISHAANKLSGKNFRWTGADDKSINLKNREHPKDTAAGVALEPQRIRTFEISYEEKPAQKVVENNS